jgi:hypothetical protein
LVIDVLLEKDRNGLIIDVALTVSSMRKIVSISAEERSGG